MKKIYICLIRPHLEYCVQLWSPVAAHGSWGTIYEIEKVQRKFTNLIDDIGTLQYGTRLAELNLTTLAERRIRGDLIETFKIVNNVVDYGHDIFTLGRSGRNIVSCGLKVSSFRKKFFSERVIQYWNVGGWSTQFMPIPHSNLKIGIGINWVKLAPTGFFWLSLTRLIDVYTGYTSGVLLLRL